ncbi:hypothetical protein M404DRAFT_999209 [Pisolithus tinctorius Marx 270]|uniref:Uncharacterized protein n=1 Tax=Pisolithus tinctorius Marx 270 TaxID=870435 RepID=A0A0C3NYT7_PISTI|nr:hypothetical protein M404DRAFT_999209 [Pisolithus tinctorius Marx 270]
MIFGSSATRSIGPVDVSSQLVGGRGLAVVKGTYLFACLSKTDHLAMLIAGDLRRNLYFLGAFASRETSREFDTSFRIACARAFERFR